MQLTCCGKGNSRPQLGHRLLPEMGGIVHSYSSK